MSEGTTFLKNLFKDGKKEIVIGTAIAGLIVTSIQVEANRLAGLKKIEQGQVASTPVTAAAQTPSQPVAKTSPAGQRHAL